MRDEGVCFSLCLWEGDLLGSGAAKSVWEYGSMNSKLWSGLPSDLLEKMLTTMLPASTKCRFRAVCKRWRRLLSSPEVWLPSPSGSPPLLGKLYRWCRDVDRHMKPLKEGFTLEKHDLKSALSNIPKSHLVPFDCVVDLPFVPHPNGLDRWVVQHGLVCLAYRTDLRTAYIHVYIVNPMNRTWKLLPRCNNWARLWCWNVGVVVSRPPDCDFHVLVAGWSGEFPECALLWRYSSASNEWEMFQGPADDDYRQEMLSGCQFALTSNTMYIVEAKAQAIFLYTAEAGSLLLSKQFLPLPCPYFGGAGLAQVLKVISHSDKVYAVGAYGHNWAQGRKGALTLLGDDQSSEILGPTGVAIWELNAMKNGWELVSKAPDPMFGDYHHHAHVARKKQKLYHGLQGSLDYKSGREEGLWFTDDPFFRLSWAEVVGDLACISLWVSDMEVEEVGGANDNHWEKEIPSLEWDERNELPPFRQDVFYDFADKTWHNGRTFLCPNAKDAFSAQVMVDKCSEYFEPRLDIVFRNL